MCSGGLFLFYTKMEDKLHKLGGCKGCSKKCLFNGKVAVKEVAEARNEPYECNDLRDRRR